MKLEIGYNAAFEVRREAVGEVGPGLPGILFLSDLHLNRWSGRMIDALIMEISRLDPSIVLLGGDYVDTMYGLKHFEKLLRFLSGHKHVYAIPGNHDRGRRLKEIRRMADKYGVSWLNDADSSIFLKGQRIFIRGGSPVKKETNDHDLRILFVHKPVDLGICREYYDLVFAGHLHGCQCVLWQSQGALYPGRLFYRWNRLNAKSGNCHYFISKGLGDTLPIRYNCRKDIIFVEAGYIRQTLVQQQKHI